MNTDRIEQQIDLPVPVARVWQAWTDFREFSAWFQLRLEGPFIVGRETKGQITHPGYTHLSSTFTVQALEPMSRFVFTWHPYAVDPHVDSSQEEPPRIELKVEPIPSRCRITATESGFDQLPAARRADAFRMNQSGWAEQLQNIAAYVPAS